MCSRACFAQRRNIDKYQTVEDRAYNLFYAVEFSQGCFAYLAGFSAQLVRTNEYYFVFPSSTCIGFLSIALVAYVHNTPSPPATGNNPLYSSCMDPVMYCLKSPGSRVKCLRLSICCKAHNLFLDAATPWSILTGGTFVMGHHPEGNILSGLLCILPNFHVSSKRGALGKHHVHNEVAAGDPLTPTETETQTQTHLPETRSWLFVVWCVDSCSFGSKLIFDALSFVRMH